MADIEYSRADKRMISLSRRELHSVEYMLSTIGVREST
jgi:hypothetical protein